MFEVLEHLPYITLEETYTFPKNKKASPCDYGFHRIWTSSHGPRRDKTRLWGFRQSETQTSLLSCSDLLEN